MSLAAITLDRATERGHIIAWDETKDGTFVVQVRWNGGHRILRYSPFEIIAFCDGLLVAS